MWLKLKQQISCVVHFQFLSIKFGAFTIECERINGCKCGEHTEQWMAAESGEAKLLLNQFLWIIYWFVDCIRLDRHPCEVLMLTSVFRSNSESISIHSSANAHINSFLFVLFLYWVVCDSFFFWIFHINVVVNN